MLSRVPDIPELTGDAPAIAGIRRRFEALSASRDPLLIEGEPGTGKEEVARALHRHNGGTISQFVVAAVSETAAGEIEALLFGSGAALMRASEGTIYFDDVAALTPELQARILRLIQEREFCPLGHNKPVKTGARVVAGTTHDLAERVDEGLFNARLLERLSAARIALPPLRERGEDLPLLIRHYLAKEAAQLSIMPKRMSTAAIAKLSALDWPGNLPQLESVCRRATAFTTGRKIDVDDLPEALWQKPARRADGWARALARWANAALEEGETGLLNHVVPEVERVLITAALERTGGQRQEAARLLGWGRNTLTRKIRDLDIETD